MKLVRATLLSAIAIAAAAGCAEREDPPAPVHLVRTTVAELEQAAALRIDLGAPQTLYVIEYREPAALRKVTVTGGPRGDFGLGTRIDARVDPGHGVREVVLSGDPRIVDGYVAGAPYGASLSGAKEGIAVTAQALRKVRCCDSCEDIGGGGIGPLLCTGCRGCDD